MLQMRGRVLGEYEVEPVEGSRCFELPMEDELFVVIVFVIARWCLAVRCVYLRGRILPVSVT